MSSIAKIGFAVTVFFFSLFAQAECIPYSEAATLDGMDPLRVVTLEGRLGFNEMAREFLLANQDQQSTELFKAVSRVSITFTPNETEIVDPLDRSKRVCLPKQFTLDIKDAEQLVKAHQKVRTRAIVKIKGLLAFTTSSIELVDNGLLTDVEFQ